jgi:8-oxo-dGTP pyrophosphatase MutT (NUDIX family)
MAIDPRDPRELNAATLRAVLMSEVARFLPTTPRGVAAKAEALRQLPTLDRPMEELADPVHVTASGFVVGARGVLLHEHKSLKMWLQPGGHIELGEWPDDAALREAFEETGLHCRHVGEERTLVRVDVHPGPRGHTHLDLGYLLTCQPTDPRPPAGESQHISWLTFHEARLVCAPDLVEFMEVLEVAAKMHDFDVVDPS